MEETFIEIPQLVKVLQRAEQDRDVRLFLVFGEEEYLVRQTRLQLVRRFVEPGTEDFGLVKQTLEKMKCDELLDLLRSPSLFSSERCFDLTDTAYFKGSVKDHGISRLADYLKSPGATDVTIIFSTDKKVDKRSLLYKTVKKSGSILEFPAFDIYSAGQSNRDGMYPYIVSYLGHAGKRIETDAFRELRMRTDNNLYAVIQELEKLIAYSSSKKNISLSDVELLVPLSRSDQIFRLTDAILEGNYRPAVLLMEELISRGTPATHIIQLMARQYRNLAQARQLVDAAGIRLQSGQSGYISFRDRVLPEWKTRFAEDMESGLFPILRNHPYVVFKQVMSCARFTENQLKHGLTILKEMDRRVKSSGGLPNHLLREMIFVINRAG